ncbi:hypothetical protein LCGC14_1004970, partial [marine sediment metagenome]
NVSPFNITANEFFGDINATFVKIALGSGSPTIDQMQEYLDNTGSSGFFLGGGLSDGGSGTLDVAAGSGFIRTTNDTNAELQSFKWSASSGIAVTDNTTQYVYVDDSGVISLSTNEFLERPDLIQIGVVVKESGAIEHAFSLGVRLQESIGEAGRFLRRVDGISRNNRLGGLILGQSGDANRDVTMTTGELLWGRTTYPISAFDTSGADTFVTYSASGKENATASQWNNTHYDNSGTLTLMTNNRWANHFVYLEPDDHVIFVFGREQFVTQAQAENEDVPSSSLPTRITETSILIGRFTFQKSDNTATIVTNFPAGIFNSAGVTDHGNLAGLSDDDHVQYLLASGLRALSGNWDAGAFNVSIDSPTFFVDSTNNRVGIGTISPGRIFEVFGDASVFRFRDSGATASSTTAFIEFGGTDSGVWNRTGWVGDGSSGSTDISLRAEVGDLLLADSSGVTMTLSGGDATFSGTLDVQGTDTTITNAVNPSFITTDTTNTVSTVMQSQNAIGFIGTSTNHPLVLMSNGSEHMRIMSGGNVGIGTQSPDYLGEFSRSIDNSGTVDDPIDATVDGGIIYLTNSDASVDAWSGLGFGARSEVLGSGDTWWLQSIHKGQDDVDFRIGWQDSSDASINTALYIDSTGNVGIGTSSPGSKLHLDSTAGTDMRIESNAADARVIFFNGSTFEGGVGWDAGTDVFALWGSGNSAFPALSVDNLANVGIGTANPDTKLHLSANTAATLRIESTDTAITAGEEFGVIEFETQDATNPGVAARIVSVAEGTGANPSLTFETSSGGTLSEWMSIDSAGRVGIGAPNWFMQGGLTATPTNTANTIWSASGAHPDFSSGDFIIQGRSSANRKIHFIQGTGNVTVMTIDSAGLVGIGTDSPASPLETKRSDSGVHWTLDKAGTDVASIAASSVGMEIDALAGGQIRLNNDQLDVDTSILSSQAGTSFFVEGSSGNVGIGTSTPQNLLNVDGDANVTGTFYGADAEFNGGWTSGGLSIINGDIFAQTGWFYNITGLDVSTLKINGSLLPQTGFDNQFDIGSTALRWKDLHLGGEVFSNGTGDNYFLGNIGIGTDSPSFPLHIDGTGSGALQIDVTQINSVDTNRAILINWTNDNNAVGGALVWIDSASGNNEHFAIRPRRTASSNLVDFEMNQASAMTILDNLNVGIGTSSPSRLLHVQDGAYGGSISATNQKLILESDGAVQLQLLTPNTNGAHIFFGDPESDTVGRITYNHVDNDMSFWQGSQERLTIALGNVGIGTTSPAEKLDVAGNILLQSTGPRLLFNETDTTDRNWNILSNAGDLFFQEADAAFSSFTTRVTFEEGGNVGIGTTSPFLNVGSASGDYSAGNTGLHAKGTVGILIAEGSTVGRLHLADSGATAGKLNFFLDYRDDALKFQAADDSLNPSTVMTIEHDGNVGIGTTTPQNLLNVDGDGNFTGVIYRNNKLLIDWSEATNGTLWKADSDVAADEISEGKIAFSTACAAGNHYYLNGNDLACEADADTTYTAGLGLNLSGTVFNHNDSSSQASSGNSDLTYIQDVTLDTYGHVTGLVADTINTATPADGVTTSLSTADQIFDYIAGLAHITWANAVNGTLFSQADWDTNYSANDAAWRLDTDTFVANYSEFLTHIDWSEAVNGTLYLSSNPSGYIDWSEAVNGTLFSQVDWDTNYTANDAAWRSTTNTSYALVDEPLWTANYSTFLTHIDWSEAVNGTLANTEIDETFDENLIVTKNFTVDSTDFFVNSNTGNVGIGTTSPVDTLSIKRPFAAIAQEAGVLRIELNDTNGLDDDSGPLIWFAVTDDGISNQNIASIAGVRDGADTEGKLKFFAGTNGAEEFMTIDKEGHMDLYDGSGNSDVRLSTIGDSYFNGGDVGIGMSTPQVPLHVGLGGTVLVVGGTLTNLELFASDGADITIGVGTTVDATIIGMEGAGVSPLSFTAAIAAAGATNDFYAFGSGTNYGAASSIRWKENIQPIDDALDKILNTRGVYFDWIDDGRHDMGFIAEELGLVMPESVTFDGDGWAYAVDYGSITPLLVEGIKEQQNQIDYLKTENELMKQSLCKLGENYWC